MKPMSERMFEEMQHRSNFTRTAVRVPSPYQRVWGPDADPRARWWYNTISDDRHHARANRAPAPAAQRCQCGVVHQEKYTSTYEER
jgi:hypothetical protein